MKRNKRVIESLIVACFMVALAAVTSFAGSGENTTEAYEAVVTLSDINEEIPMASVQAVEHDMVAAAEADITEEVNTAEDEEAVVAEATEAETTENVEETETSAEENVEVPVEEVAETEVVENEEEQPLTKEERIQEAIDDQGATPSSGIFQAINTEIVISSTEADIVIEERVAAEEAAAAAREAAWQNIVMPNVESCMNVRTLPDEESEVAGKFYKGDTAEIVSVEGDWTLIQSGNVTGYVKNDLLVVGTDAADMAEELCDEVAIVNTQGLRIRSAASEEAEVLKQVDENKKLEVATDAEAVEGWVAVKCDKKVGYVSADYVTVTLDTGKALTMDEVKAKEAEERKKKNRVAATADELTLLAGICQLEAGGTYDGMVAVGSVVMNRVRSGRYPSSIRGVIYQGGQFTPALNGSLDALIARGGIGSTAYAAAQAVLDGAETTGGCLQFRSARSGAAGTNIGGNVFF